MNRRDQNTGNRQAGGYRGDDSNWDTPRQANQWQGDLSRQSGGDWDSDDADRGAYRTQDRDPGSRYSGDSQGSSNRSYRDSDQWGAGERSHRGSYGASDRSYGNPGSTSDRGYRFSGSGREASHDFDASGGNSYGSFTSEDFGGRDFSAGQSGGVTGGLHPSNSYRPSYGPGSWSRHRDAGSSDRDSWRAYGESRGFFEKAGDEIASWFGDEDAARRRDRDHRGRGPSDYTRSDERIREDVNDTLTHDWRVDASNVRVVVKDGEVTLEGTVDSRQDKRRAEDLADDVSGVRHVQNNLRLNSTSSQSRSTYGSATGVTGTSSATTTPSTSATSTSSTSGSNT